MKISRNKVALLGYTLTLEDGSIADQADAQHPLAYIQGVGMLLPAFESQLEGKQVGDKFNFTLSAEEGYGIYYPENVAEFPIAMFRQAGFPEEAIEVGAYVPMQDDQGQPLDGEIVEIEGDMVIVDFNHPLAGEKLNFQGEILQVREATQEELSHGHVHGAGSHNH
ncbi:MAG: peptidylprolyl isomerase [Microscillaceae bacterium]|jgi:FKBP-type peptidyl-prolyl cis-trans isomerase SlyD|nr:peptidylprolyl isomerase [Microscillaceae bacterium]